MALFTGAGVALVTPFHQDKTVNYEMLDVLLERQINAGTDAVIVCGTTGEPATLSANEKDEITRRAVQTVAGRVPVIVGTGANSTPLAIEQSIRAEALGADGLLLVTPYYNKATQKGLYAHFKAIAEQVQIPIILYNVPSRTGCNLKPGTAVELAKDCKNIVGIKEASGDIVQITELAALSRGCLDIYSGNDDQVIPVLALGGCGVISVASNVIPEEMHRLVHLFLEGQTGAALDMQLNYLPLIHALFLEVNPIPVKAAMDLLGYPCGGMRMPLTELEEEHKRVLLSAINNLKIKKEES